MNAILHLFSWSQIWLSFPLWEEVFSANNATESGHLYFKKSTCIILHANNSINSNAYQNIENMKSHIKGEKWNNI